MLQVVVAGQLWNYWKIGVGRRVSPILILHGWGRSANEWELIGKELNGVTGRVVYCLDLPGFGSSNVPDVETLEEYVQLLINWLDYMKIGICDVVGHSLGGKVAIMLAVMRPKLVEKLVLVDPAGVKPRSVRRKGLNILAKIFHWLPVEIRRNTSRLVMDEDFRNFPALHDLYLAVVRDDLQTLLPKLISPTWVIWGEKDPILPVKLTMVYSKLLPYPTIRIVWGAGHDPHLSNTKEFTRILEEVWI